MRLLYVSSFSELGFGLDVAGQQTRKTAGALALERRIRSSRGGAPALERGRLREVEVVVVVEVRWEWVCSYRLRVFS